MKKALNTICFIMVIVLSSCNEQVPEFDPTLPRFQSNTTIASPATADSINATNTEQQEIPGETGATTALNPEHGMPGHRCDIAVGAPLNSPNASQPTAPAYSPSLSSPVNMGGSVGLNPPHGQPGHDCSIPVGQPLRG